jgi:uncharacterized repeat protein (TIGR01451 family)
MIKGLRLFGLAAIVAGSFASEALAQTPGQGCIVLKSVAEIEQVVTNDKGEKSVKLVPAGKVVPGVEVTYTVTANNICKQAADKATISNPVPEHMTYVENSAIGPGTDITFSLDGKTFGAPDALTVQEGGATRRARADEYRQIRWVFKDPLQPGAQGFARFRAVLN